MSRLPWRADRDRTQHGRTFDATGRESPVDEAQGAAPPSAKTWSFRTVTASSLVTPTAALLFVGSIALSPPSALGAQTQSCGSHKKAAAAPPGDPACPGVRPGAAAFNTKDRADCTFGFILRGSDGARYVIVGHRCAPASRPSVSVKVGESREEHTWPRGKGPQVSDSTGKPVGRLVYDVRIVEKALMIDFALLRLDKGIKYSPTMCQFGGPRRINSIIDNQPTFASIYGQSNEYTKVDGSHGYEDLIPQGLNNPEIVNGARTSQLNNDGAPVLSGDGGQALGIMGEAWTHAGTNPQEDGSQAENPYGSYIYRLGPVIQRLERALHLRLALVNAGER